MIFFPYIDIENSNYMESLQKIKDLIEKMSVETTKVTQRGNHSASIRARKYAQEIKSLIPVYRKDILKKIQSQNASD